MNDLGLHERFVTTQALKAELERFVQKHTEAILVRLSGEYRSGNLEPIQALAGIAAIAELKSLLSKVETDYKRTLKAVEKSTSARSHSG